jgi:hypothetical protein
MPTDQTLYVNRTSGAIGRITGVDESYAHLQIIWPKPSSHTMLRKDYDETFAKRWRPAKESEMPGKIIPPPAHIEEEDWADKPVKIGEPY